MSVCEKAKILKTHIILHFRIRETAVAMLHNASKSGEIIECHYSTMHTHHIYNSNIYNTFLLLVMDHVNVYCRHRNRRCLPPSQQ